MIAWGNVAEWVGSVGTVGALGLGLLLLSREVQDSRKRHASRVVAWIDGDAGMAYVRNDGDEPVTYVMLALFTAGHYAEPMSGQGDTTPFVESKEWLAPGEGFTLSPSDAEWQAGLFPPRIRLEFTDASGRRWLRDEKGQLWPKKVRVFSQDKTSAKQWKRDERETAKARELFTRWRWPNI